MNSSTRRDFPTPAGAEHGHEVAGAVASPRRRTRPTARRAAGRGPTSGESRPPRARAVRAQLRADAVASPSRAVERRRLGRHRVAHQPVCRVVDRGSRPAPASSSRRFAAFTRLPLAGRPRRARSVRDHLAGRRSPTRAPSRTPNAGSSSPRQSGEHLAQLDRGAHGPERVVLVQQRDAEHRHQHVARDSPRPSRRGARAPRACRRAQCELTRRRASASRLSRSRAPESTTQANSTVTVLRISRRGRQAVRRRRAARRSSNTCSGRDSPRSSWRAEVDQLRARRQAVVDDLRRRLREQRRAAGRQRPQPARRG